MRDIENMLSKHTPKPKRLLPSNFTETIMSEIKLRPRLGAWHRLILTLRVRLVSKVGITSIAGVVLVSGTVAALTLWPKPTVTPTVTQQLPSGNHIVGYDTQNCNYFDELDGGPVRPTHEAVYYEIRKGSSLTDQQLRSTLQGICEENVSNAAISYIVNTSFAKTKNTAGFQSTEAYTINAITSTSLTITMDSHYNAALYTTLPNQTYNRFSDQLLIYNENNKISFSDLHAGDTIKMIVQDTSGKNSEPTENYNPLNHPTNIVILAIVKIPALTEDPSAFYTSIGKDIVRVEPCKTSPTGFCRAYNFIN